MAEEIAKQFNPFIIRVSGLVSTDDTSTLVSIAAQYGL